MKYKRLLNFSISSTPDMNERDLVMELSRKRAVKKSNMDSSTIKAGIHLRSKQLTDPDFASNVLESSLSHIKYD